jgi:hypothetical protein
MNAFEEKSTPAHKEHEAEEAMMALTQLFSTPEVKAKAHRRCGINGPTEFDVLFERCLMTFSAAIPIAITNAG